MSLPQKMVEEIVRRILAVSSPERVILFGSAARGTMTPDSDVDLLVVHPEPVDHRQEYLRIRRALRGLGLPFDVILVSREWFEESKDVVGGIAHPAHRHGRVIHEAA